MNALLDLLRSLFSNLFGVIIVISALQFLYRRFFGSQREERGNDTLLRPVRAMFNEFDMGRSEIDSANSIIDVSTSNRGYNSFSERDMYRNVIEENMTYSYNEKEKYDNPKELYDAGLITYREYLSMLTPRNRGGK
jgi:predicted transcriptional regulator